MAATTVPLYSGVLQECTVEEAGSSHEVLPGLMPVFQGLSTLMAELGVDWDNWNGPAIQVGLRMLLLQQFVVIWLGNALALAAFGAMCMTI